MPGTCSQILLHIVFSTKRREPWITPDVAERLYLYMGGIVRSETGSLYDIGGIEDHVHMYMLVAARRHGVRPDACRQGELVEVDP